MQVGSDLKHVDLLQAFRTATIYANPRHNVGLAALFKSINPHVLQLTVIVPRMEPATTQRSPSLVRPQPAQNDHHRPEDEMKDPNLEQLVDVGVTILSQALDLVNDSLTSDEQLTVHSQYMPGSTIGTVLIPRSQGPSARLILNA